MEIIVDYGLPDVVAVGSTPAFVLQVAKDMIAVSLGPRVPMVIVGSSKYFRSHAAPTNPDQLVDDRCINLRLPTSGALNAKLRV